MKAKVMKPNTMMISVQCQTDFTNRIMGKYAWSISPAKRVQIQYKEDAPAKKASSGEMPKIVLNQLIQPLYLKLAMQYLSFSQIAVYKQQLLKEVKDSITILKAAQEGRSSQTSVREVAVPVNQTVHTTLVNLTQNNSANQLLWTQLKQVAQHFSQDRFLQGILEKRSTQVNYETHVRHTEQVIKQSILHHLEHEPEQQVINLVNMSGRLAAEAERRTELIKQAEQYIAAAAEQQSEVSRIADAIQAQAVKQTEQNELAVEKRDVSLTSQSMNQRQAEHQKSPSEPTMSSVVSSEAIVQRTANSPSVKLIWHERVQTRQSEWNSEQAQISKTQEEIKRQEEVLIKQVAQINTGVERKVISQNDRLAEQRQQAGLNTQTNIQALRNEIAEEQKKVTQSRQESEQRGALQHRGEEVQRLQGRSAEESIQTTQAAIGAVNHLANQAQEQQQLHRQAVLRMSLGNKQGKFTARRVERKEEKQDAEQVQNHTAQIITKKLRLSDIRAQLTLHHFKITSTQRHELQKLRIKDIAKRKIKRIEQKLLKEQIKLQYAVQTIKRKPGRPKKENNQPELKRQAVTLYKNRKPAVLLKQEMTTQPIVQATQAAHIQRIVSVNERWLQKLDTKKQIKLIHILNQNRASTNGKPPVIIGGLHTAKSVDDAINGTLKQNRELSSVIAYENKEIAINRRLLMKIEHVDLRSIRTQQLTVAKALQHKLEANAAPFNGQQEQSLQLPLSAKWQHKIEKETVQQMRVIELQQKLVRRLEKLPQQKIIEWLPIHEQIELKNGRNVRLTATIRMINAQDQLVQRVSRIYQQIIKNRQWDKQRNLLQDARTIAHKATEQLIHIQPTAGNQDGSSASGQGTRQAVTEASIQTAQVTQSAASRGQVTASPAQASPALGLRSASLAHRNQRRLIVKRDSFVQGLTERSQIKRALQKAMLRVYNERNIVKPTNAASGQGMGAKPEVTHITAQGETNSPLTQSLQQPIAARRAINKDVILHQAARQSLTVSEAEKSRTIELSSSEQQLLVREVIQSNPSLIQQTAQQLVRQQLAVRQTTLQQLAARRALNLKLTAKPLVVPTSATSSAEQANGQLIVRQPSPRQPLVARRSGSIQSPLPQGSGQHLVSPANQQTAAHAIAQQPTLLHKEATLTNHPQKSKAKLPSADNGNDNVGKTLSVKRVELEAVKKQVQLMVKSEQVSSPRKQAEPIVKLQSHIKELEQQIKDQQQQLQKVNNPLTIKQLSNQIYMELSKKIRLDQQRLGR